MPFATAVKGGTLASAEIRVLGRDGVTCIPCFLRDLPSGLGSITSIYMGGSASGGRFGCSRCPFCTRGACECGDSSRTRSCGAFICSACLRVPEGARVRLHEVTRRRNFLSSRLAISRGVRVMGGCVSGDGACSLGAPGVPSNGSFTA